MVKLATAARCHQWPLTATQLADIVPLMPHAPDSHAPDFDELQRRAEGLLEEAIAAAGARDPREFYRTRLKELRQQSLEAYEKAVDHYRTVLVPSIADDEAEPLAAWTEYGRQLALLSAEGRTVALDASGRAHPYEVPADRDALVLHLPDDRRQRALVVGLPIELSPAQRAAYDWLVAGRNRLQEAS
jgi:hypothetical protein